MFLEIRSWNFFAVYFEFGATMFPSRPAKHDLARLVLGDLSARALTPSADAI